MVRIISARIKLILFVFFLFLIIMVVIAVGIVIGLILIVPLILISILIRMFGKRNQNFDRKEEVKKELTKNNKGKEIIDAKFEEVNKTEN